MSDNTDWESVAKRLEFELALARAEASEAKRKAMHYKSKLYELEKGTKLKRDKLTPAQRLEIAEANDFICHITALPIDPVKDAWEIDHIIPLWMGGMDEGDNMAPVLSWAHKQKTADEAGTRAKANRIKVKHFGAKPSKFKSKWKKKVDGTTVLREPAEVIELFPKDEE